MDFEPDVCVEGGVTAVDSSIKGDHREEVISLQKINSAECSVQFSSLSPV